MIDDAGLVHLESLSGLRYVILAETSVTHAGLLQLKNLTQLQGLRLENTKVTAAGVAGLEKALPTLKVVH